MKYDPEQYYDVFVEGELYCKMVLPKEFDVIIPMAKRLSENVETKAVVAFISGFDTYVTTKII